LGALPLQRDGRAFYYSDYTTDARKVFHWDRWPCCSGTLPLLAADYAINLCFTDRLGLYVNLYAPAQVTWQQAGIACRLSMTTDYPYDGIVSLALTSPIPVRFTLHLRIPAWVPAARVNINGVRHPLCSAPGTFAAIDREWSPGDRVDLELSLPMRWLSIDAQHPHSVALLAGPLVLMRLLDGKEDGDAMLTRRDLLSARRPFAASRDWQVRTPGSTLIFRPFMDINAERYRVYQTVAPDDSRASSITSAGVASLRWPR
jgi:uncharacterized protein